MAEDLKLFEQQQVRSSYDEDSEKWYFSIIDIIGILTESKNPRRYWSDLKIKLSDEDGFSQLYEKIVQLKLTASDGKKYNTDCADVETLLRIIQSVPSKKAEPVKQWLARVGYERMKELADPSTALDRARDIWQKQGRSEKWIQQRMSGQDVLFPKKRNQSVGHFFNKNIIYVCSIIADLCGVNYRKFHKQLQARFV